ncbi:hypothetical protein [Bradyrhizobium japonicum]|uniref:hypothetical protein n=1 Tax=Bradyrhizobium japonicum TaxID=375 RepID=UPI0003F92E1B|nr:hypothetical protein [Bradyrhizobium japonicum]
MHFPRYRGDGEVKEAADRVLAGGSEVILVVEDNEEVRTYSMMILSEVLEAKAADAAIGSAVRSAHRSPVHGRGASWQERQGLADETTKLRPGL